jgi:hypothetical protein
MIDPGGELRQADAATLLEALIHRRARSPR